MNWDSACLICDKENEDSDCRMKGYWKRDDPRFDIDMCITCFDKLQNKIAARKAMNRLEEVLEDDNQADFDKLLDNSAIRNALWENVLPVWSRQKYRDAEEQ